MPDEKPSKILPIHPKKKYDYERDVLDALRELEEFQRDLKIRDALESQKRRVRISPDDAPGA